MRGPVPPSSRSNSVPALVAAVALMVSCAAQRGPQSPTDIRPLPVDNPASWERIVDGAFENKGVAQVERLGRQWLLTVMCNGTHATYIDDTGLDLSTYGDAYLHVRYRYVERTNADVRCVKEPCPPSRERRVAIERVTRLTTTPDEAGELARTCR